MANLYELTGEMLHVKELLDMEDLNEEVLEGLQEVLTDTSMDYTEKLEKYGFLIRNLQADLEAYSNEEKFFAEKKKKTQKKIDVLKESIFRSMKATDTAKVKGTVLTISLQKNPASVVMDEQYIENIPDEFLIPQDPKLDKKKIAEALRNGENLEGIAHLEQSEGVRIK